MKGTYTLLSPSGSPGAISIINIHGALADAASAAGFHLPQLGRLTLSRIFDLDDALIARFETDSVMIMPHGGIAITRAICVRLNNCGFIQNNPSPVNPGRAPDSGTLLQLVHQALSRTQSPLAIDVILRHASLASESLAGINMILEAPQHITTQLAKLLTPPTVVVLGATNIGKSTLTNALARDTVSVVADAPGTTRDYVGVTLECNGLMIRYIDAPGLRRDANHDELRAVETAMKAASMADLLLLARDPHTDYITLPESLRRIPAIRICLRSDTAGQIPDCDLALGMLHTSTGPTQQLVTLTTLIRSTLVSDAAITEQRLWRFWMM